MKLLVDILFIISFLTFGTSTRFTLVALMHGFFGAAWISAIIAGYTGPVSYILNTMEFIEEGE